MNKPIKVALADAGAFGIKHVTIELADSLALPKVDAAIFCTPMPMHAGQTLECRKAGHARAGGNSAGR